jgi:hypothetical protein
MNAAYANMEMPKPPLPALFGFISATVRMNDWFFYPAAA